MLGIIGAMDEEVAKLKETMQDVTVETKASMEFYKGTMNGKDVVVVRSGIGKVNAGICTQILCDRESAGCSRLEESMMRKGSFPISCRLVSARKIIWQRSRSKSGYPCDARRKTANLLQRGMRLYAWRDRRWWNISRVAVARSCRSWQCIF